MPEKDHNLTQRELLLLDIMGKRLGEGDEEDFSVSITSPSTDEGLFYNGSEWVNLPLVAGSSISVSGRTISVDSTKESNWDTAYTHSQITIGNPHDIQAGDITSGQFADGRISQSSVTQHEAAINHDNLSNFVGNEHIDHSSVSISGGTGLSGGGAITISRTLNLNIPGLTALTSGLVSTDELAVSDGGTHKRMDISVLQSYMQSNLSFTNDTNDFLTGLSFATGTGILTATVQNQANPTVDLDGRYSLTSHTHPAGDITSGTFANARISQSSVTQHEAALTITESQISDLGNYAVVGHSHSTSDITSGTFANARISQSSVTQHEAALTITESQITDGSILARLAAAETVTGQWTFNNGLLVSGQANLTPSSNLVRFFDTLRMEVSDTTIATMRRTGASTNGRGQILNFQQQNSNGNYVNVARLVPHINDITAGSEDSDIEIRVLSAGSSFVRFKVDFDGCYLNGNVRHPDHDTTSNASNMNIDSTSGLIKRSTSSRRYKKDIRPFENIYQLNRPYNSALDIVNALNPVIFNSKSKRDGDKDFIGLIAEDVHKVIPELVTYIENEDTGEMMPDWVEYPKLTAVLIAAVKEQQTEIENLKAQLL